MKTIADLRGSRNVANLPVPEASYPHIDRVAGWRVGELNDQHRAIIERNCLNLDERALWCRFSRRYTHRLVIDLPNPIALAALAEAGFYLNYVEITLDLIFKHYADCHTGFLLIDRHRVVSHHGKNKVKLINQATLYFARRHASNNLTVYWDEKSKVSNESNCLHIEARLSGRQACSRQGIDTVSDLQSLDLSLFWRRNLRLFEVDFEKAGKCYRSSREKHTPTTGRASRLGYALWRTGGWLATRRWKNEAGKWCKEWDPETEKCGRTQHFVDSYKGRFNVRRCLNEIDISAWLEARSDVFGLKDQVGVWLEVKGAKTGVAEVQETSVAPKEVGQLSSCVHNH
jgi:hypothetical protein